MMHAWPLHVWVFATHQACVFEDPANARVRLVSCAWLSQNWVQREQTVLAEYALVPAPQPLQGGEKVSPSCSVQFSTSN